MHVSDLRLLERFVVDREEAAFVAIVERHGPRVQGTCRRVLRNEHDVEDVFQATFLLLARKAPLIDWRESIGNWLCAAAHRLALGFRADRSRYKRREASFAALRGDAGRRDGWLPESVHPLADPVDTIEQRDLRDLLISELGRLPEKYRAPVVLCDLEGRTHQEAAEQLGWPSGSISRRLVHARELLRERLTHRGVTLAIGLAGVSLAVLAACRSSSREGAVSSMQRPVVSTAVKAHSKTLPALVSVTKSLSGRLSSPGYDVIAGLAGQMARASGEIEKIDPGTRPDDWKSYAAGMNRSALNLARAAENRDQLAMLSASRQLDASCIRCHEVFRE